MAFLLRRGVAATSPSSSVALGPLRCRRIVFGTEQQEEALLRTPPRWSLSTLTSSRPALDEGGRRHLSERGLVAFPATPLRTFRRGFGRGKRDPPFGHSKFTPPFAGFELGVMVFAFVCLMIGLLDWRRLKDEYGIDILPEFLYRQLTQDLDLKYDRVVIDRTPPSSARTMLTERQQEIHKFMLHQARKELLQELLATGDEELKALLEGKEVSSPADPAAYKVKRDMVRELLSSADGDPAYFKAMSVEELLQKFGDKENDDDDDNQGWRGLLKKRVSETLKKVASVLAETDVKVASGNDDHGDDEGAGTLHKGRQTGFRNRKIVEYENRIRMYSTPDKIFRYFATYRVFDDKGHSEVMMTPQDFLRSLMPGVQQPEALGLDQFENVSIDEVAEVSKQFGVGETSIFRQLGAGGLITFTDYVFLLTVLSTSRRHFEIAFKMFDLNGDGNVDAREFENVTNLMRTQTSVGARHRDHVSTGSTLKGLNSGLVTYFFGLSREGVLTVDKFLGFQRELQNEILRLEFDRKLLLQKQPDGTAPRSPLPGLRVPEAAARSSRINEADFADLLIAYAGFSSKKKAQMLKRVRKGFGSSSSVGAGGGVSLRDYLNFYQVLYSINDIDTALTFYHMAGAPIERETMKRVAQTVAGVELSDHIIDVVFVLFDENGDGKLSNREFVSVMKQRAMRGLERPKDTGVGRIFAALTHCAAAHSQPTILGGLRKTE